MGYIQGADRNQIILLPDTLDDYVGGEHEVRAIDAFIDSLDIATMGIKAEPASEGRPGYDPRCILDYLERRKKQLTDALAQMENSRENQLCTTDPECRLMKTRDGIHPSYNVQTAVETDNHLIVDYEVTNECVDRNLLEKGINGAKAALDAENLEDIADRGYGNNDEVLACLLNGDAPTTHPNKGEKCRTGGASLWNGKKMARGWLSADEREVESSG